MNFGWLKAPPAWWKKTTLITEDAGCLSHVTWRNGALVDAKGVAWTMVGTVPQVAGTKTIPPGAGPFSLANYYKTTATSDVLDIAGDFSAAVVLYLPASTAGLDAFIVSSGIKFGAAGWDLYMYDDGAIHSQFHTINSGGTPTQSNLDGMGAGRIHVLCGGRSGTNQRVKIDLQTIVTTAGTMTDVDATRSSAIGVPSTVSGSAFGLAGSYVMEIYVTTTAASDALFTSIANAVKAKGITSW